MTLEERMEQAKAEAQRQIDSGLIQGAVFASFEHPEPVTAGLQTEKPQARPMTANSRFDIASCGKVFTAGCCARLIADGKLDPDAPFTTYLPESALKDSPVTVRDLAMHVSGFNNAKPYQSPDMNVFFYELYHKQPVRPRLEMFEYSCTNFILLGRILNHVTGKDLDTLAREMLWAPLGMTHTTWNAPGDGPDEVEHWDPNRPAGVHNDQVCNYCPFPIGSGSCFSTAGDMLLFLKDIAERKHFPKAYYDLITTCGYDRPCTDRTFGGSRRSFGWDMTDEKRPAGFSRNSIFHSGWTGQTICVDPETGMGAVVMTSRKGDWDEAYNGRNRIMERMYGTAE